LRNPGPAALAKVDSALLPDELFLDAVNDGMASIWKVTLMGDNKEVEFKVDTGAAVTANTERLYAALHRPELTPASKTLYGPAQQNLVVRAASSNNSHIRIVLLTWSYT